MNLLGSWRAADDPRRVELYTRWSLLPSVVVAPLVVLGFTVEHDRIGAFVAATGSLAQAAVVATALSRVVDRTPWGRSLVGLWILGSLLALVTGVVALRGAGEGQVVVSAAVAILGLAPLGRFPFRRYAVPVAATAVLLTAPFARDGALVAVLASYAVVAAGIVQMSMWLLDVVRRLADAERDRVKLALAEERLRFARDLHDVVGRDLSAIAVTSDLVAELARRGRPEAVERAEEVRTIAQNSLEQIRAVVRGYRTVDLTAELEGSVALLKSAGVEGTVEHDEADLPDDLRSAAAWVIREGVTNVVRHSAATWCRITVTGGPARLAVRIENDGVTPAQHRPGSGLAGLAERLQPFGGTLDTRRGDGTFTLEARLETTA